MEGIKIVLVVMAMLGLANGYLGDYHSSSSAAFDEGKLESISRFYNQGTGYI